MATDNSEKIVTLIGGSGFVGRHLVQALTKRGYRVRVACRRPDLAGHVQPLGFPGQVMPVQANLRYPASLAAACADADAVVNLAGVLSSSGAQSFGAVHVFGAEASAKAARAAGAKVFIQLSAIGADSQSASAYAASKGLGEQRARAAFPGAVVVRPSLVFGPEDGFFNKFAAMTRMSFMLPLIGGGETRFQPVFVGDVAEAIAQLVDRGEASGKTYELGGPEVFSFAQLMQFTLDTVERKRLLVPVPWFAARLMGTVFGLLDNSVVRGVTLGLLPRAPLTTDQVELLRHDNVVGAEAVAQGRDLTGFGIAPRSIKAIVPAYLYRYRKAGQFSPVSG